MAISLVTFGDVKFTDALRRLEHEAVASGFFDTVSIVRPSDLGAAFWRRHGRFVSANTHGYGYWIWKPWILLKALRESAPGDFIVYLDADYKVDPAGAQLFSHYRQMASESEVGLLAFQIERLEKHHTKGDMFRRLDAWHLGDTPQVRGGRIVARNGPASVAFMEEWLSVVEDYRLLSDAPSEVPNDPGFVAHRHDQSALSLLAKLRGAALLYAPDTDTGEPAPFVSAHLKGKLPRPFPTLRRNIEVARLRLGAWRPRP